jgi:hypothetical protein
MYPFLFPVKHDCIDTVRQRGRSPCNVPPTLETLMSELGPQRHPYRNSVIVCSDFPRLLPRMRVRLFSAMLLCVDFAVIFDSAIGPILRCTTSKDIVEGWIRPRANKGLRRVHQQSGSLWYSLNATYSRIALYGWRCCTPYME